MDQATLLRDLQEQVGDFGKYQLRQHLLHFMIAMVAGIQVFTPSMVAQTPLHRCFIPELDSSINGSALDFFNSQFHRHIPRMLVEDLPKSCVKYVLEGVDQGKQLAGCDGKYVYDYTYFMSSRVIEMNMVCENKWKRALMHSAYMLGVFLGALIFGFLASRYGRIPGFRLRFVIQLGIGLLVPFVTEYYMYVATLFVYGIFGSVGLYTMAFTLTMEIVGPTKRTICGVSLAFSYCVGSMLVPLWALLIQEAWLLQMVLNLHGAVLLLPLWYMEDSIESMLSRGDIQDAVKAAEKAAQVNGRPFINRYRDVPLAPTNALTEPPTIRSFLNRPVMRERIFILSVCFITLSAAYHGPHFNAGDLVGNPFLVQFMLSLAEAPAYIAIVPLMRTTGRRSLCAVMTVIAGTCCVVASVLQKSIYGTILIMIAKCSIAVSCAIIFHYSMEIFPKVARNSALGYAAMAGYFSGVLTPWMTLIDGVGWQVPVAVFGSAAIISAFWMLCLPETRGTQAPQTLEDGEEFRRGDTAYKALWNCIRRKPQRNSSGETAESADRCAASLESEL